MNKPAKIPGVSVYKPKRRSEPHHRWLIAYVDLDGRRKVESASTDEEITRRRAIKISERLELRRLGLVSKRELGAIDHAATPLLPRLDAHGARIAEADGRVRPNHLDDYLGLLRARGRSPRWVQMVGSRCALVFARAEFELIGDVAPDAVELAIGALGDEQDWSDRTRHHSYKQVKQFTRWLRKSGRALVDELEDLVPPPVLEAVHARRALDEKELAALIRAAAKGSDYRIGLHVITGRDRRLLYRLAAETGLLANQLRTLTRESFDGLDGGRPMIRVKTRRIRRGDDAKDPQAENDRDAEVPLTRDTAQRLAKHLDGRPAGGRVWWVPDQPVRMFDVDRKAAGIARDTPKGVVDFQALRHTFCTRVRPRLEREEKQARAGAIPDATWLTGPQIDRFFNVPKERRAALRLRLHRWRPTHKEDWVEEPNPGSRDALYIYRVGAVRPLIDSLLATHAGTSSVH